MTHHTTPCRWFEIILAIQGVAGIGIVNAVEVVHAFGKHRSRGTDVTGGIKEGEPSTSSVICGGGLCSFREWLEAPDEGLIAAAARVGASGRAEKDEATKDDQAKASGNAESGEYKIVLIIRV